MRGSPVGIPVFMVGWIYSRKDRF